MSLCTSCTLTKAHTMRVVRALVSGFLLLSSLLISPVAAHATLCSEYQFSQSAGNTFTTIVGGTGTTKIIAANQDDVTSGVLSIGFSFVYDGTSYTQFSATDNGVVGLGSTAVTTTKVNGFTRNDGARSFPSIAPFWGDLVTTAGTSGVYKQLTGTAPNRCLTVEFRTKRRTTSGTATDYTYQVKLFETTNCMEFCYGTMSNANTTNATIGIATSSTRFLTLVLTNSGGTTTAATNCATSNDNVDVKTGSTPIASGTRYAFCPGGDVTLPVELSTFALSSANRTVELSWRTASEVDNAGFEVYRADVDTAFKLIASYTSSPLLNGLGTNLFGKQYRYLDGGNGELVPGRTYTYRLVDVSTDGVRHYYDPMQVQVSNVQLATPLRLDAPWPNPTTGMTQIAFDLIDASAVTIEIYSTDGRQIALPVDGVKMSEGRHVQTIDVAGLVPGTYHLRISALGRSRIETLVIQ